jgi:flagellar hook-associated protein 2
MSVDGLVSGMDTTTLISQLMQIEAQPQTLLKSQLSDTQSDAAAYRALNTRFDALRAAADALSQPATWNSAKATSSQSSVAATAGAGATTGSLTFSVKAVAETHSLISAGTYASTSATFATAGTTFQVLDAANSKKATLSFAADTSLSAAVTAINARTDLGFTAAAVQTSPGKYQLQLTATTSGSTSKFDLTGGGSFGKVTVGADAELSVGTGPDAYKVTSATNDFAGLMPGTTISVNAVTSSPVTVKVAGDPDAVAAKVSALASAANGLLDAITAYTSKDSSTAVLKGDSTLRSLSSQVLDIVAKAVGTDGSTAAAGLQLTKDGDLTFDSTKFVTKLKADPALVQRLFTASTTLPGKDGKAGTKDDVQSPVGVAAKLQALAKAASDSTTGSLTLLAASKDSAAKDIQNRIADWDIRLALRKTALTSQFTAMETALGTLQNQASWLSSQVAQLPTWSSSNKS